MSITKKQFPKDYSPNYINIMKTLSFDPKKIYVEGTFSMRGMLYPSDVDIFEKVEMNYKNIDTCYKEIELRFQKILNDLIDMKNVYITKILFGQEKHGKPLKWSVSEVLQGHKNLGDDSNLPFVDVVSDPSLCKLDVVALLNGVYVEFSNTYQFYNNKKLINKYELFQEDSLTNDIKKFKGEGNYFKMAKRLFMRDGDKDLVALFNGDAGFLNQICSNIDTLQYIVENVPQLPKTNIKQEIDGFITRINLLSNEKLTHSEHLNMLLKQSENTESRKVLQKNLAILHKDIYDIVQSISKKYLKGLKLL